MERILLEKLLMWYPEHHRDLPWRHTTDPYRIWVSEIMLQQTRVEAVKPYYDRFLTELPTITDLANCPDDQLMKLWEGLGYYSRVRNMKKAAEILVEEFGGEMPADYDSILALPGIGRYTAGAIASSAFSLPYAAVDGNVLRVLTRANLDSRCIDDEKTKKAVTEELNALYQDFTPKDCKTLNQALMELGATVCVPNGDPHCVDCPWQENCLSNIERRIEEFPVRKAKKARRIEKYTVLLIRDSNRIWIEKRPDTGLLAGLYQFPMLEGEATETDIRDAVRKLGYDPLRIQQISPAKHIFSHIEWHMTGYEVRIAEVEEAKRDAEHLIEIDTINRERALPSAFKAYTNYINEHRYF